MARPLALALHAHPLVLSIVPPPARAAPSRLSASLDATLGLVERRSRVDAISVPELIDENHDGRPFYRTADPRAYAAALALGARREVVVTKVVAHLPDEAAVSSWAEETVRLGLRHVVLVGGSSRYIPYPGPPVAAANGVVRPVLAGAGGLLGNIAIPQRTGEAHRMLAKTRAGASFFTTQLLFDPSGILDLLRRYDRLCRDAGVPPAAVLVSVAPVGDEADASFVRWLGADLPEEVERAILEPEGHDISARSVQNARELWSAVRAAVVEQGLSVPVGVNVEQLSARHLGAAEQLVEALEPELERPSSASDELGGGTAHPEPPRARTA